MMKKNGSKAIFTIDALLTLIPIMLIAYIGINSMALRAQVANFVFQDDELLKLIEVSDYMVKQNAVCENGICYANFIGNISLGPYEEKYASGFDPVDDKTCIYRIVNYQNKDDLRQIFVCKR